MKPCILTCNKYPLLRILNLKTGTRGKTYKVYNSNTLTNRNTIKVWSEFFSWILFSVRIIKMKQNKLTLTRDSVTYYSIGLSDWATPGTSKTWDTWDELYIPFKEVVISGTIVDFLFFTTQVWLTRELELDPVT